MKRLLLIIIVSIFGLINPANAQSLKEHVVQKGETLSSIAEDYNIKKKTLLKYNQKYAKQKLVDGDTLKIPRSERHIYSEGETLQSVAESYGVTVGELFELNPYIKTYGLSVGNTIILPKIEYEIDEEPITEPVEPIEKKGSAEVRHKVSNVPMQDVVYLKNGAIIKGVLLSNNTSDIMIQARDGSVFVYKPEEIERCEQEAMTHTFAGNFRILDIDKTTFGIRGGLLITQGFLEDIWDWDDWRNRFSPGFHIGATYEYSFTKTNRWFLQTGIDLQYMNARTTGSSYSDWIYGENYDDVTYVNTTNALYLEIPAMISCKFKLNDNLIFYPNIGVAYSIGLVGKYNEKASNKEYGLLRNTSENCFYKELGWYETDSDGDESYETANASIYDRHNLALKFGLNLTYNRLYFGGGVFYHVVSGMTWGFNISVGYNF